MRRMRAMVVPEGIATLVSGRAARSVQPNPSAGIETDTWLTGYPRSQDPAPHKSVPRGRTLSMSHT